MCHCPQCTSVSTSHGQGAATRPQHCHHAARKEAGWHSRARSWGYEGWNHRNAAILTKPTNTLQQLPWTLPVGGRGLGGTLWGRAQNQPGRHPDSQTAATSQWPWAWLTPHTPEGTCAQPQCRGDGAREAGRGEEQRGRGALSHGLLTPDVAPSPRELRPPPWSPLSLSVPLVGQGQ